MTTRPFATPRFIVASATRPRLDGREIRGRSGGSGEGSLNSCRDAHAQEFHGFGAVVGEDAGGQIAAPAGRGVEIGPVLADVGLAVHVRGVAMHDVLAEVVVRGEKRFAAPKTAFDIRIGRRHTGPKSGVNIVAAGVLVHRRKGRGPAEKVTGKGIRG